MLCVIGKVKVMDMCLIGCMMDVEEVECVGLVFCIVFVDDFLDVVMEVVEMIVFKFLLIVMMIKEIINCFYEMGLIEGIWFECCVF